MITGFEEQTSTITHAEKITADRLVRILKLHCHGEANAKTADKLRLHLLNTYGEGRDLKGARFRKVVNYIRTNHLVKNLISSSSGYWIETDKQRVREYVESLRQRAAAILAVSESFDISDPKPEPRQISLF